MTVKELEVLIAASDAQKKAMSGPLITQAQIAAHLNGGTVPARQISRQVSELSKRGHLKQYVTRGATSRTPKTYSVTAKGARVLAA